MFTSRTKTRRGSRRSIACAIAAAGFALGAGIAAPSAPRAHADNYVSIIMSGSTQMLTLGQLLGSQYTKIHPNVHITVNALSSQGGYDNACQGDQLGMSDNYIIDNQLTEPGCGGMRAIPVAVSATTTVYNLPGAYFNQRQSDHFTLVHPLHLSPQVVADIYIGQVTSWDSPEIKRLNPGMKLPSQPIQAFNMQEPGGAAFVFNQWLSLGAPKWPVPVSLQPLWPRGYSVGQPSSGAMVQAIKNTPYSIGFAGFDYAISYGLQAAALQDANGQYLTPSLNGVALAINAALNQHFPQDFRKPFTNVKAQNAFNPACLEFFVVQGDLKKSFPAPASASVNQAVKAFLQWTIADDGGQIYIEQIQFRKTGTANQLELAHGFVPVPDALRFVIRKNVVSINA